MAYLTVEDLITKVNSYVAKDPNINKKGMITDAWVCGKNDREYPPGTILFEVIDSNITPDIAKETSHVLSILPNRITKIN